jgi:hypothetical protein
MCITQKQKAMSVMNMEGELKNTPLLTTTVGKLTTMTKRTEQPIVLQLTEKHGSVQINYFFTY